MRKLILLFVLLAVALGTLYFVFKGERFVIQIHEQTLQEKVDAKLPIQKDGLLVFTFALEALDVDLIEADNRIRLDGDVLVTLRIGDNPKQLAGQIVANTGIDFNPKEKAFHLVDPVIEAFEVQGVPLKYIDKVSAACAKLLADYLEENSVYTMPEKDFKQSMTKALVQDLHVQGDELIVTIGY